MFHVEHCFSFSHFTPHEVLRGTSKQNHFAIVPRGTFRNNREIYVPRETIHILPDRLFYVELSDQTQKNVLRGTFYEFIINSAPINLTCLTYHVIMKIPIINHNQT